MSTTPVKRRFEPRKGLILEYFVENKSLEEIKKEILVSVILHAGLEYWMEIHTKNNHYIISPEALHSLRDTLLKNNILSHKDVEHIFLDKTDTLEWILSTNEEEFFESIGASKIYDHIETTKAYTISAYRVGPFDIKILNGIFEKSYIVSRTEIFSIIAGKISELKKGIQTIQKFREISKLRHLIESKMGKYTAQGNNITEYITLVLMDLDEIAPFLLDKDVEEIYLDAPGRYYYVDHRKYGRCRTNIVGEYLSQIITRFKLESGLPLDESNPSLKMNFNFNDIQMRVTIDIPPLSVDGPTLDIRKNTRQPLTLPDLIKNDTLTLEAAAFLVMALFLKANISIVGPPFSGKTTLLNAIDLCTPSHWRRVIIEDAIESIDQSKYYKHQLRFLVDPYETGESRRKKSAEIIKALHRTPDIIYLGEIQTSEHSKALFHAIVSGLQVISTCHGRTIESLLVRWKKFHGIPPEAIKEMNIMVEMKLIDTPFGHKRYVSRIIELGEDLKPKEIFTRKNMQLENRVPVSNTRFYTISPYLAEISEKKIAKIYGTIINYLASLPPEPSKIIKLSNELYKKVIDEILKRRELYEP